MKILSGTLCLVLLFGLLPLTQASAAVSAPLPFDTSFPTLAASHRNLAVKTSCATTTLCFQSLQTAIDQALPGDEILIDPGMTITGPITLRKKAGSGWIVIRISNLSLIPSEFNRIKPSYSSVLPKILAPGYNQNAILTEAGASYYRLVGLEVAKASPQAAASELISLGSNNLSQSTLSAVPHHIILDRLYIHGDSTSDLKRGVGLNSAYSAVLDSYISEIHSSSQDAQAICGFNGPGPFKIENNYLEASGENVLFGGDDPKIANLIPSDIEIKNNFFSKPLAWRTSSSWVVKNILELKNANRVLISGNILENSWKNAQNGYAVLFNTTNQGGRCPWCAVTNLTMTNNIVRHAGGGVQMQGNDYHYPDSPGRTANILIQNNLFEDISSSTYGGTGWLFHLEGGTKEPGPENLTISHNTAFQTGQIVMAGSYFSSDLIYSPKPGFVFENNLALHNTYGVFGGNSGVGDRSLADYFPQAVFQKNVLVGGPSRSYSAHPGNYFPASLDQVGFADRTGGNYQLTSQSPYKNAGTDGKDIGADIVAVKAATASAASGTRTSSAPVVTTPVPESLKVDAFDAINQQNMAVATFAVSDPIGVVRVELFRANYSATCTELSKSGCNWSEVTRIYAGGLLKTWSGKLYDHPSAGTYFYGLHVVNSSGSWAHEAVPVKVVIY
ncbi:MAG: hypothetical protein ACM3KM_03275 [Acidobacteriaceae bacterium]